MLGQCDSFGGARRVQLQDLSHGCKGTGEDSPVAGAGLNQVFQFLAVQISVEQFVDSFIDGVPRFLAVENEKPVHHFAELTIPCGIPIQSESREEMGGEGLSLRSVFEGAARGRTASTIPT